MTNNSAKAEYIELPVGEIFADHSFNCRGELRPQDVLMLAQDIAAKGLIQPIVVGPKSKKTGKYLLIAGYRRYTAIMMLKWDSVPSVVRSDIFTEEDTRIFNLCENLQRKDLTVAQEARALKHLYDMGMSVADVSSKLGQSRDWANVRVMFLDLPDSVQSEIETARVGVGNIKKLHGVYKAGGNTAVFEAVKSVKTMMSTQLTQSLEKHKKVVDTRLSKKVRKRSEVQELSAHLLKLLGDNLAARSLAWATGDITTYELMLDLEKTTQELGKTYIPFESTC